jgi:hypothetical protein
MAGTVDSSRVIDNDGGSNDDDNDGDNGDDTHRQQRTERELCSDITTNGRDLAKMAADYP